MSAPSYLLSRRSERRLSARRVREVQPSKPSVSVDRSSARWRDGKSPSPASSRTARSARRGCFVYSSHGIGKTTFAVTRRSIFSAHGQLCGPAKSTTSRSRAVEGRRRRARHALGGATTEDDRDATRSAGLSSLIWIPAITKTHRGEGLGPTAGRGDRRRAVAAFDPRRPQRAAQRPQHGRDPARALPDQAVRLARVEPLRAISQSCRTVVRARCREWRPATPCCSPTQTVVRRRTSGSTRR